MREGLQATWDDPDAELVKLILFGFRNHPLCTTDEDIEVTDMIWGDGSAGMSTGHPAEDLGWVPSILMVTHSHHLQLWSRGPSTFFRPSQH